MERQVQDRRCVVAFMYFAYIGCSKSACATGCMQPCKEGLLQAELHLGGLLVHAIVSE